MQRCEVAGRFPVQAGAVPEALLRTRRFARPGAARAGRARLAGEAVNSIHATGAHGDGQGQLRASGRGCGRVVREGRAKLGLDDEGDIAAHQAADEVALRRIVLGEEDAAADRALAVHGCAALVNGCNGHALAASAEVEAPHGQCRELLQDGAEGAVEARNARRRRVGAPVVDFARRLQAGSIVARNRGVLLQQSTRVVAQARSLDGRDEQRRGVDGHPLRCGEVVTEVREEGDLQPDAALEGRHGDDDGRVRDT